MMKYRFKHVCIVISLLLLVQSQALANSWNLPGTLSGVFEANPMYNDYTRGAADEDTLSGTPVDYAVFEMRSKDCNTLFVAQETDGKWEIVAQNTAALHQDGWDSPSRCQIEKTSAGGFVISYPGESYTFDRVFDEWRMTQAQWDNGRSMLQGINDVGLYQFTRDGESIYWNIIFFEPANLNIDLMPKTVDDVRNLNRARSLAIHRIRHPFVSYGPRIEYGTGTADVYSAPSEDAYRAANGKASVSLKDGLWILGEEDGWYLVYYLINAGAGRCGYIRASSLDSSTSGVEMFREATPIRSATYLTDDPLISQAPLMQLEAGQTVDFLSVLEPFHAYVETQKDGATLRGFVPLKDMDVKAEITGEILPELVGRWEIWAGGTMYANVIDFAADGTCTSYGENPDTAAQEVQAVHAQWRIEDYDRSRGNFNWADLDKMIVFTNDNGTIQRYGFVFDAEGFSLTDGEGSGGFQRVMP